MPEWVKNSWNFFSVNCVVVGDNCLGDVKSGKNVSFVEMEDVLQGDFGQRFCLYPFCEVINGNQDEAVPIRSHRSNLSNHVDAPHCKWPRSSQDV